MNDDDVRRILRGLDPEDHDLQAPPPAVWDRIADEVGISARAVEAPVGLAGPPDDGATESTVDVTGPPGEGAADTTVARAAEPTALASRRRRLPALLGAAAAVVLVAAIGGTALLGVLRDATVAEVDLAALDTRAANTPARIVEVDGAQELRIQADLPETDGYYEVWLLDEAVETLVSLGPLREDGRYPIPPEVNLVDLPVVDISAEPDDGDPGHSGDSVLRGTVDLDA